jgi:ABC-type dipeptide/oligopeptide/nickel transport system permease subunit
MTTTRPTESSAEVVNGIAAGLAAGGILTIALAPLAIPILALTVVFVVPLVPLLIVPALAIGAIVGMFRLVRGTVRRGASWARAARPEGRKLASR